MKAFMGFDQIPSGPNALYAMEKNLARRRRRASYAHSSGRHSNSETADREEVVDDTKETMAHRVDRAKAERILLEQQQRERLMAAAEAGPSQAAPDSIVVKHIGVSPGMFRAGSEQESDSTMTTPAASFAPYLGSYMPTPPIGRGLAMWEGAGDGGMDAFALVNARRLQGNRNEPMVEQYFLLRADQEQQRADEQHKHNLRVLGGEERSSKEVGVGFGDKHESNVRLAIWGGQEAPDWGWLAPGKGKSMVGRERAEDAGDETAEGDGAYHQARGDMRLAKPQMVMRGWPTRSNAAMVQ